jgi:hypothetical protein
MWSQELGISVLIRWIEREETKRDEQRRLTCINCFTNSIHSSLRHCCNVGKDMSCGRVWHCWLFRHCQFKRVFWTRTRRRQLSVVRKRSALKLMRETIQVILRNSRGVCHRRLMKPVCLICCTSAPSTSWPVDAFWSLVSSQWQIVAAMTLTNDLVRSLPWHMICPWP